MIRRLQRSDGKLTGDHLRDSAMNELADCMQHNQRQPEGTNPPRRLDESRHSLESRNGTVLEVVKVHMQIRGHQRQQNDCQRTVGPSQQKTANDNPGEVDFLKAQVGNRRDIADHDQTQHAASRQHQGRIGNRSQHGLQFRTEFQQHMQSQNAQHQPQHGHQTLINRNACNQAS